MSIGKFNSFSQKNIQYLLLNSSLKKDDYQLNSISFKYIYFTKFFHVKGDRERVGICDIKN